MKKRIGILMIVVLGLLLSVNASSQEVVVTKQEKKELRKQKKAARKAEKEMYDKSMHEVAFKALKDRDFVLEAHTLYNKRGYAKQVTDNLNFIAVEGDEAVLQLAFRGYGGPNGIGGITLSGRVSNIEYKTDKHGNQYLNFNVMGAVLHADVYITLYGSNNTAEAQVNAVTTSGKLKFRGEILPTELSSFYKSGLEY